MLKVDFDRRLKLEFHGSKITSGAGLLAYRELDENLGPTDLGRQALSDLRRGKNTYHHRLFCFNHFGDLERCFLCPGNVHSAEDWRLVLEPVVTRYRDRPLRRHFRALRSRRL